MLIDRFEIEVNSDRIAFSVADSNLFPSDYLDGSQISGIICVDNHHFFLALGEGLAPHPKVSRLKTEYRRKFYRSRFGRLFCWSNIPHTGGSLSTEINCCFD